MPWDKLEEWTGVLRDMNFVAADMLQARHDLLDQGVSPQTDADDTGQDRATRVEGLCHPASAEARGSTGAVVRQLGY